MRVLLDMTDSKRKESILKRYVDTIVLHIVFELYLKTLFSYELDSH